MTFIRANLSIHETAKAMGIDPQSLRVLIQNDTFTWAKAVKKPGSGHYFYLISPKGFYEETGCLLGGNWPDDFDIWEQVQTKHSNDADFVQYAQRRKDETDLKAEMVRRTNNEI